MIYLSLTFAFCRFCNNVCLSSLVNLTNINNCAIVQPNEVPYDEKTIYVSDKLPDIISTNLMVIPEKTYLALYNIINKYYKHLIYLTELVNAYPDIDKLSENRQYWKVCNNLKL